MNTCELLNTWTVMKSSDSGLFLYIAHRWHRCWYHLLQHPLPAPDQHVQCLPSHIKTVNQPHLGACNFAKAGLMTIYICLGMTSYVGCLTLPVLSLFFPCSFITYLYSYYRIKLLISDFSSSILKQIASCSFLFTQSPN